jgi:glutathione S-transferase
MINMTFNTMMKLYYIHSTRAFRPRWLLEEIGIDYELVNMTIELSRQPEYRKLHPHGKVPVLVDNDVTIYESAAICAYLGDKYQDKRFAPPLNSPARAYYYQWLFYASVTLEAPVEQYMFHVLTDLPEKLLPKSDRTKVSKEEALQWFEQVCQPLNEVLAHQEYLVDNQFSVADVVTGGVFYWALKLGMMEQESPVKTYISNLMERSAFQQANIYNPLHADSI